MKNQLNFPGFRRPTSDFGAVRTDFQTGPLMYELDLTTARSIGAGTVAILAIAGNALYVDQAADVGNATLIFQDDSNIRPARVYVAAGFNYRGPWTRLMIENTAQPGKMLRFFYGVDIDFQPGLNAQVQITGTVAVQEQGIAYAAGFASTAALAANTPQSVWTAAANVNGAILWRAGLMSNNTTPNLTLGAFICKAAAPAGVADGDVLMSTSARHQAQVALESSGGDQYATLRLAAGKRGDFIVSAAESSGYRSCLYTLL